MTRKLTAVFSALLVVGGGACTTSSNGDGVSREPRGGAQIIFPVQDPTNEGMQALLVGTLIQRERCLYVSDAEGENLILPIWPEGFSHGSTDGSISVLDAEGRRVARVGSPIRLGGGIFGEGEAPLPPGLEPRVGSCDGPYWIVGEVEERR